MPTIVSLPSAGKSPVFFSYKENLLYGLFGMFILGLCFKYSALFVLITLLGFAVLTLFCPVYGYTGMVNFAFLSFGSGISLIGVKN
jgi:hypothetical protein